MSVGQIIKLERKRQDIPLKDLALAVHKTHSCVTAWEKGRTEPNITDIKKICKFLGLSPNDLFEWTDEDNPTSDRQLINKIYSMIGMRE